MVCVVVVSEVWPDGLSARSSCKNGEGAVHKGCVTGSAGRPIALRLCRDRLHKGLSAMVFHSESDRELWQPAYRTVFTKALQRTKEGGSAATIPLLSQGGK